MNLEVYGEKQRVWFSRYHPYRMVRWDMYKYKNLSKIMYRKRPGRGDNSTYNECWIMADTETSKKKTNETFYEDDILKYKPVENHVVAWTISIRAFGINIVTLYGNRPTEMMDCIDEIQDNLKGFETIIYFHNLTYDWTFLKKFFILHHEIPMKQLNTKAHYPINIIFSDGLILKDSYILAQRSLEKWAKDLNVEHQKASGKWEYDKLRKQDYVFDQDELEYIEHDTLAGVECLDTLCKSISKTVGTMPYTATGIVRDDLRKLGKAAGARKKFKSMHMTYEQYVIAEKVFHGGFTHANRHAIDCVYKDVSCKDFASSYPFVMLSEKYPMEKFGKLEDKSIDYILDHSDDYAFMFKLVLIRPRLKDDFIPMPALQFSKCTSTINAINDNGRVLCAAYVEIYITEMDLKVITEQYTYDKAICNDIWCATKDYLPRWFTDYVYGRFKDKTMLKGGDIVNYMLQKAKANSCYGVTVQKSIKDEIIEDYVTGEYTYAQHDPEELYEKYINNRNSILPYQWGVWVCAYAFYNIHQLGKCCTPEYNGNPDSLWIYTDTDSCYAQNWNEDMVAAYNNSAKEKLIKNGYGPVLHNNREYWLGIAEDDGTYSEYKALGAKRYCGRSVDDNKLHITVAGVPKSGYSCLNDDINQFTKGFRFPGTATGKLMHTYINVPEIYIDEDGNETGDSIDLTPCDYLLDSVDTFTWEDFLYDISEVQIYEE